ncbi:MAG: hypothetical protein RSE41_09480, partial [Clostridia bacterium]
CVILESRGLSHEYAVKLIKKYNYLSESLDACINTFDESKLNEESHDFTDKIAGKEEKGIFDEEKMEDTCDCEKEDKQLSEEFGTKFDTDDTTVEDDFTTDAIETEDDFEEDMPSSDESKIEIKEFVLTVDDVEAAKRELAERGINVIDNISSEDSIESSDDFSDDLSDDTDDFSDDTDDFSDDMNLEESNPVMEDDGDMLNEDDDIYEDDDIFADDDIFDDGDTITDRTLSDEENFNTEDTTDDITGEQGEIKISTEGWSDEQFKEFNDWLQQYGVIADDLLGGKLEMEDVNTEDLRDDINVSDDTTEVTDDISVEESTIGTRQRTSFGH